MTKYDSISRSVYVPQWWPGNICHSDGLAICATVMAGNMCHSDGWQYLPQWWPGNETSLEGVPWPDRISNAVSTHCIHSLLDNPFRGRWMDYHKTMATSHVVVQTAKYFCQVLSTYQLCSILKSFTYEICSHLYILEWGNYVSEELHVTCMWSSCHSIEQAKRP